MIQGYANKMDLSELDLMINTGLPVFLAAEILNQREARKDVSLSALNPDATN